MRETPREKTESAMKLIECTEAEHSAAILEILNDAIVNSTAIYDYEPRPPESMKPWFAAKALGSYPVIGAVSEGGELCGFATYGRFRPHAAYKYTVESSVYVHPRHRGRKVGLALMKELISRATEQEVHVLVGGIDAANQASIRLHESLGFSCSGVIRQAGYKFGRWLDLAFYQLILPTPMTPLEGEPRLQKH